MVADANFNGQNSEDPKLKPSEYFFSLKQIQTLSQKFIINEKKKKNSGEN